MTPPPVGEARARARDGTTAQILRSADHWSANLSRDGATPSNARRHGRRTDIGANRRAAEGVGPYGEDGHFRAFAGDDTESDIVPRGRLIAAPTA